MPARRPLACVLAAAFLWLVGCTGAPSPSPVRSVAGAGGTLRLGMDSPLYYALDPQYEYDNAPWELFRCCLLRTLMSYGPATGTAPQPDLASAPPDVSIDGLTWTFHLRAGLHYGPPLQAVPITSPDIVRALLRVGDPATGNPGYATYLSSIDGFTAYAEGKADSVAGLETPNPLTLRIRQLHPDASLPYVLALPMTAPIPPLPGHPAARFGVATSHDRSGDPSDQGGYGRFLVATGPYMIEGADALDFSRTAASQSPVAGFRPWTNRSDFSTVHAGSITLVRNPSWDPATDPLRSALADRIEVEGGDPATLFRRVADGDLAMVFDDTPPAAMTERFQRSASLRPLLHIEDGLETFTADFNVAQPPFDDLAVRRAVAFALDRRPLVASVREGFGLGGAALADHYVPDDAEDSLLSGWDPFPGPAGSADLRAAHQAMAASRYATGGRCTAPACEHVEVVVNPGMGAGAVAPIRAALASLGIHASVALAPGQGPDSFYGRCPDASTHVGICAGNGWYNDVPSAGNTLTGLFSTTSFDDLSHLGASADQLASWGYAAGRVPSVDAEIARCNDEPGAGEVACWARLDQYLLTRLMPSIPLAFTQEVRLTSPGIARFAWDPAFGQPALDRLAVSP